MKTKNIKDHGKTHEEKSRLGPLTEAEFIAWCLEEGTRSLVEKYLDEPYPGELDNLSIEELEIALLPGLWLGEDDFF